MLRLVLLAALASVALGSPVSQDALKSVNPRIIMGNHTTIDDVPYQVSVRHAGAHMCGGAIVNSRIILTAASCLNNRFVADVAIRSGSTFRDRGGVVYPALDILSHPQYNHATLVNNIGAIKLEFPIVYGLGAARVVMSVPETEIVAGTTGLIAGWGLANEDGEGTENLQIAEVEIIEHELCRELYESFNEVTDDMFCAGNVEDGGPDACSQDAGGPIMVNGVAVGIISWGVGCGRPNFPGVYTSLPATVEWFHAVTL